MHVYPEPFQIRGLYRRHDSLSPSDVIAIIGRAMVPLVDLAETSFGCAALQDLFGIYNEEIMEYRSISTTEIAGALRQWRGLGAFDEVICTIYDVPGCRAVDWENSRVGEIWKFETLETTAAGRLLLGSPPGKVRRDQYLMTGRKEGRSEGTEQHVKRWARISLRFWRTNSALCS